MNKRKSSKKCIQEDNDKILNYWDLVQFAIMYSTHKREEYFWENSILQSAEANSKCVKWKLYFRLSSRSCQKTNMTSNIETDLPLSWLKLRGLPSKWPLYVKCRRGDLVPDDVCCRFSLTSANPRLLLGCQERGDREYTGR